MNIKKQDPLKESVVGPHICYRFPSPEECTRSDTKVLRAGRMKSLNFFSGKILLGTVVFICGTHSLSDDLSLSCAPCCRSTFSTLRTSLGGTINATEDPSSTLIDHVALLMYFRKGCIYVSVSAGVGIGCWSSADSLRSNIKVYWYMEVRASFSTSLSTPLSSAFWMYGAASSETDCQKSSSTSRSIPSSKAVLW